MIKPGNLVKITRGSIGIPRGTLALVVRTEGRFTGHLVDEGDWQMYTVEPFGEAVHRNITIRRYYARDLELVS